MPPVPTACPPVTGTLATSNTLTPEELTKQLLLCALVKSNTNGITVTKPDGSQNFQPARHIPTNVVSTGPPVDQLAQDILQLTPDLRHQLQEKLAQEGL